MLANIRILVIVLIVLVVAGGIGVGIWLLARRRAQTRPNITAAPPFRKPTDGDKIIARMINAANYDLRSLELGDWLVSQLSRAIVAAGATCQSRDKIDYYALVNKIPGVNDVTKMELQNHMRDLVGVACSRVAATTPQQLVAELRRMADAAVNPDKGLLVGMPGYSVKSAVVLPP